MTFLTPFPSSSTELKPPMRLKASKRPCASGCMTPAPGGQTPGGECTKRQMCLPCGVSISQISWGMVRGMPGPASHGAVHSMLGMHRISLERFGVAPCHARWSRKIPEPAGAPTSVERRIHSGSSAEEGGNCTLACVPGIWRMGPFSQVESTMRKLMVPEAGRLSETCRILLRVSSSAFLPCRSMPMRCACFSRCSKSLPRKVPSPRGGPSRCRCWYSMAPGRQRSPPAPLMA
mmetsp:Transcript_58849/g.182820  ORF Transcript_58849/g.182820 Transcript_58849/m.182820 type:complete len:233 (-) Transcript_58849:648-1346(-)